MDRIPITKAGAIKLEQTLEKLKNIDRPQVISAIAEARAHGDLKENAEYHAAKEQQGMIESKIADIESKLPRLHVIDISQMDNDGKVIFGCLVEILDIEKDQKFTYKIVGEDESDLNLGMISITSPIARGLVGKYEGDEVEIQTPSGATEFEILTVSYT